MSLAGEVLARVQSMRQSSALRLSLLLSCLFAIAMTVAILIALHVAQDALERRANATLTSLAASVDGTQATRDSSDAIIRALTMIEDLPAEFAQAAEEGGGKIHLEEDFRQADEWRVLIAEDRNGSPVLIATPLDDSEEALEVLGGILWITTAVVVAIALALGVGAGLLANRRFTLILGALDRLAEGDLKARTGVLEARDDLDFLSQQIDRTANELEKLVTQTRHLSANLAHDLRTPLARLSARLEALPDSPEREGALDEAMRLSETFDAIMRVARIEAAQGNESFETVDLAELIEELAETFEAVVEDKGKRLAVSREQPGSVRADRQMLIQAMANLVQNALIHGGKEIGLYAQRNEIGVTDTGPGVDPARFEDIVKPMVRLDAARETPGAGLGLALVRAVADRHRAALILSENRPNGLCVAIRFGES